MNKTLLQYYIAKAGLTSEAFCSKLKVSKATYYHKINGQTPFTVPDIVKIAGICNLQGEDILNIFFNHYVENPSRITNNH